jgi:hypothetical protein
VLRWEDRLNAVRDSRRKPQIATRVILRAAVVMFLGRLGSLNALEQSKPSRFWRRWLGGELPSADTIGRVCGFVDVEGVRAVLHQKYTRLKRMKALEPPSHGLMVAVVDAHESTASYRRCCSGCLQRVIRTNDGERIQYYHRFVALRLVGRDISITLDIEPMIPGEDELAAARRLVERVLQRYPRAFDVVAGDGLYANTEWFLFLGSHGLYALAVLKENRPNLLEDARTLFGFRPGVDLSEGDLRRQCWDSGDFTSWPEMAERVRVVRSLETRTVRRQRDDQVETLTADWYWVTTLPTLQAPTAAVIRMGHDRWNIENQGFNELVNRWHADHVYRHQPTAMLVFALLAMLCLNLFTAFYYRNLKAAVRRTASMLHVARLILAELYSEIASGPARAPT